jgi:hypothetical protein
VAGEAGETGGCGSETGAKGVAATTGDGGGSRGAGFAALVGSAAAVDADDGVALAFGGTVTPALTRSSLLGGCTALVVIIAPPANPTAMAAKATPIPAKKDELL